MLSITLILPYVSVAVFILGIIYKLCRWLSIPVPLPITTFPVPKNPASRLGIFLKKLFLFSNLFLENRLLWLLSWMMHLALALIIIGHIVGIYFLGKQFTIFGVSDQASQALSHDLGMAAGILFIVTLVGLAARRLLHPEAKASSLLSNYFELALLLAIALSGMLLRLSLTEAMLLEIRQYLAALFHFQLVPFPHSPSFFWHFVLINILIIYLPFSKLIHGAGGFVIRSLLLEQPPAYPTPEGKPLRSSFTSRKDEIGGKSA